MYIFDEQALLHQIQGWLRVLMNFFYPVVKTILILFCLIKAVMVSPKPILSVIDALKWMLLTLKSIMTNIFVNIDNVHISIYAVKYFSIYEKKKVYGLANVIFLERCLSGIFLRHSFPHSFITFQISVLYIDTIIYFFYLHKKYIL